MFAAIAANLDAPSPARELLNIAAFVFLCTFVGILAVKLLGALLDRVLSCSHGWVMPFQNEGEFYFVCCRCGRYQLTRGGPWSEDKLHDFIRRRGLQEKARALENSGGYHG